MRQPVSRRQHPAASNRARTGLALALLTLPAACKRGSGPGGTTFDYGSPRVLPAPVSGGVLTMVSGWVPRRSVAFLQNAAQSLLNTDPRHTVRNTPSRSITFDNDQQVAGLNSYPPKSSGAAFAHAAGLTGAGQTIGVIDTRPDRWPGPVESGREVRPRFRQWDGLRRFRFGRHFADLPDATFGTYRTPRQARPCRKLRQPVGPKRYRRGSGDQLLVLRKTAGQNLCPADPCPARISRKARGRIPAPR